MEVISTDFIDIDVFQLYVLDKQHGENTKDKIQNNTKKHHLVSTEK